VLGVGILENAYDQTAKIAVVPPDRFVETEEALLSEARSLMPKLPFDRIDILIVDEIGKEISGNGMDTNIVGRFGEPHKDWPKIDRIFVRDLTTLTQGNAIGIGLADVTTNRLINRIDMEATKVNCLTGQSPELGRIPIGFENDHEALMALTRMSGVPTPQLKLVWIKNTLELSDCIVSSAYLKEIERRRDLQQATDLTDLRFDEGMNLIGLSYGRSWPPSSDP
jgi:hypothetical protein